MSVDQQMSISSWWEKKEIGTTKLDPSGETECRGLLVLTCMSMASVTCVVGVCMVMKHDGMDLGGWWHFVAKGEPAPYLLCPFLGECWASRNDTVLYKGTGGWVAAQAANDEAFPAVANVTATCETCWETRNGPCVAHYQC